MKIVLYQKNSEVWDFIYWLGFVSFFTSFFVGWETTSGNWQHQTHYKIFLLCWTAISALCMIVGHKISWKIQERELKKLGGTIIKW